MDGTHPGHVGIPCTAHTLLHRSSGGFYDQVFLLPCFFPSILGFHRPSIINCWKCLKMLCRYCRNHGAAGLKFLPKTVSPIVYTSCLWANVDSGLSVYIRNPPTHEFQPGKSRCHAFHPPKGHQRWSGWWKYHSPSDGSKEYVSSSRCKTPRAPGCNCHYQGMIF